MAAEAGTGHWRACASDDRCTLMTEHSGSNGSVIAFERLLRTGATGGPRPTAVTGFRLKLKFNTAGQGGRKSPNHARSGPTRLRRGRAIAR